MMPIDMFRIVFDAGRHCNAEKNIWHPKKSCIIAHTIFQLNPLRFYMAPLAIKNFIRCLMILGGMIS